MSWRPVNPCAALKTLVIPCVAGLDLLKNPLLGDCWLEASKTRFLEAWMLAGLEGLEEVADRWEEGTGRTEDIEDFLEGLRT